MLWWIIAAVLVAWPACYVGSCWWFPFKHCWCCKGTGKHSREDSKVFRNCRWCRGTGRRLRIGRRVYNFVHLRRERAK